MKKYEWFVDRRWAVLYLAWELGTNNERIQKSLKNLERDEYGRYDLLGFSTILSSPRSRSRLRDVEFFRGRVRDAVAWQCGRLRIPIHTF